MDSQAESRGFESLIPLDVTARKLVGETSGAPVREVRRRVCAWQVTRESTSAWPTLRRWAGAMGDRFAQIAMGRAPPHTEHRERWALAFAGGSAVR